MCLARIARTAVRAVRRSSRLLRPFAVEGLDRLRSLLRTESVEKAPLAVETIGVRVFAVERTVAIRGAVSAGTVVRHAVTMCVHAVDANTLSCNPQPFLAPKPFVQYTLGHEHL